MSEPAPRKALVIAVGFPPMGGSGVQRTAKFVKYLPDFGWRSAVLTGDPERDTPDMLDRSLLAELPADLEIRRVPYWHPFEKLLDRLTLRRKAPERGLPAALATPTESARPELVGAVRGAFRRFKQLLYAPVGDGYYYWSRKVRRPALDFIRLVRPRLIYVSASPFSSLLLGLWLKRRTGLPLVADFRDPWTLFAPRLARGLRFRIDRHCERQVLRGADVILTVNEPISSDFRKLEPVCQDRCKVIPNGFDPADFEGLPAVERACTLAHVGMAYEDSPLPVLRALSALRSRGTLPAGFRARFVGGLPPSSLALWRELGLEEVLSVEPRSPHAQAIAAMRSSAWLLLLLVRTEEGGKCHPAKVFEYLAAGRPILCIAPPGLAADLVRESGCGLVLNPDDSAGIEKTLSEIAADPDGFAARVYRPRAEVIARFDRRKQAARLAEIFEQVAARGQAGGS